MQWLKLTWSVQIESNQLLFLTLQAKPIVTTITIGGSVPFSSQRTFYHKQWKILPLLAGFWAIL